ncbi:MAG: efflux RND transporter periplasmic adaptor subunit, partial [Gammaproteobacteria bacterium]
STKLVTLQSLDPLYIRFFLPEQNLKNLFLGQKILLEIEAYPDEEFVSEITAINAKVDESTHNIEVQATVPNSDTRLYPGVFANIRVLLPEAQDVVTVPHTAIDYTLYGNSVFVIREEGEDQDGRPILRSYRQYVTVGQQRGIDTAVEEGLRAGELVIDSGQMKLGNGTRVKIDNSVKLEQKQNLGP